ncbi:MAG: response regulator [Candidatus Omnitrophica bacterium]|nr:response regulator [Candidatus Omnitrophota bacterium]
MEKKHKRILVIDDEPDSLMTLSMALKSLGYVVLGALNGKEGLKIFREEKPDLVILDIVMPLMDGWEVLKRIKAGFKSKRVPVILITGKSEEESKEKSYRYKADFYVTKPYDLKHLILTIEDMLSE